jgi:hypothetical protein
MKRARPSGKVGPAHGKAGGMIPGMKKILTLQQINCDILLLPDALCNCTLTNARHACSGCLLTVETLTEFCGCPSSQRGHTHFLSVCGLHRVGRN